MSATQNFYTGGMEIGQLHEVKNINSSHSWRRCAAMSIIFIHQYMVDIQK